MTSSSNPKDEEWEIEDLLADRIIAGLDDENDMHQTLHIMIHMAQESNMPWTAAKVLNFLARQRDEDDDMQRLAAWGLHFLAARGFAYRESIEPLNGVLMARNYMARQMAMMALGNMACCGVGEQRSADILGHLLGREGDFTDNAFELDIALGSLRRIGIRPRSDVNRPANGRDNSLPEAGKSTNSIPGIGGPNRKGRDHEVR